MRPADRSPASGARRPRDEFPRRLRRWNRPATGREVIHAEDARRARPGVRQRHDPAQQCHPSNPEAQLGGQTRASPSSEREPDALQDLAEPRSEACIRRGQPCEGFGGRATWAVSCATDETPDRQTDHNALPGQRQILEPALVGVVHPIREPATARTRAPAARPLAKMSIVPKAAVTSSTSTSSIPSNTSESQNVMSACMTSTVTDQGQLRWGQRQT